LFPPFIFANADTSGNNATALFAIKFQTAPQNVFTISAAGPRSVRENTKLDPAQWTGNWLGDGVYVTLLNDDGGKMTAQVTDQSAIPSLQFSEDFVMSKIHWALSHDFANMASRLVQRSGGIKPAQLVAAAVSQALREAGSADKGSAGERFSRIVETRSAASGVAVDAAGVRKIATSLSHTVEQSKATVALSHGVYLTLYDVYEGNVLKGMSLYYERHGPAGIVFTSAWLTYYPDLH
jgi:hypothetical protein